MKMLREYIPIQSHALLCTHRAHAPFLSLVQLIPLYPPRLFGQEIEDEEEDDTAVTV